MDYLELASSESISRGSDYYKEGKVLSYNQIGEGIFSSKVKGSGDSIYNVIVDVNHPKRSICDCPFAEGNLKICKHKVAVYFTLFPDKALDYEEWRHSSFVFDCYDYDDEDYYQDDFVDYRRKCEDVPSCYDELLENYIAKLDLKELKNLAKSYLNNDKYYTFKKYLQKEYRDYLTKNPYYDMIESLSNNLGKLCTIRDFDYTDYNKSLLTNEEKNWIDKSYGSNYRIDRMIDDILLRPALSIYSGYVWVINFYKNKLSEKEKEKFNNDLNNAFNNLKHYGIRNTDCKSNTLIAIDLLNDFDNSQLAKSILRNCKYTKYVEHVIKNNKDIYNLYDEVISCLDKGNVPNRSDAINVLLAFYPRIKNDLKAAQRMFDDHSYYDFLYNFKEESLLYFVERNNDKYINKIRANLKKLEHFLAYYTCFKEYDNLYNLIKKEDNKYLFGKYLNVLKDTRENELFNYYRDNFYLVLEKGMGRDIYREAAENLEYIKKLNNGKMLIEKIHNELLNSKYSNRPALFDEISRYLDNTKLTK